jgi:hypothetical protein
LNRFQSSGFDTLSHRFLRSVTEPAEVKLVEAIPDTLIMSGGGILVDT